MYLNFLIVYKNVNESQYSVISWNYLYFLVKTPPPTNGCPGYDTKQSDSEVPVMLRFWGMWSTPSLPWLPGPLCPGVVAPDWALSMGQIELHFYAKLNYSK